MSEEWDLFSGVPAKFKGEAVERDLDVSQMVGMDAGRELTFSFLPSLL